MYKQRSRLRGEIYCSSQQSPESGRHGKWHQMALISSELTLGLHKGQRRTGSRPIQPDAVRDGNFDRKSGNLRVQTK